MLVTRRLFFGLELSRSRQQEIVRWRGENFALASGHPVAGGRLHLTLAFLGDVSERQQALLTAKADNIAQPSFTLLLDDAGYWPHSRVVWLGMRQPPWDLLQLASLLRAQAARIGCAPQNGNYHPHITLYRQAPADVRLPSPGFCWRQPVCEFVLFAADSHSRRAGYRAVARWPLAARPVLEV